MNIAQQILEETKNSECQYLEAFKVAGSKDGVEEFRREMSIVFMFNDSSRLKFSGGCVDAMSSCGYSIDDIEVTGYYMESGIAQPLKVEHTTLAKVILDETKHLDFPYSAAAVRAAAMSEPEQDWDEGTTTFTLPDGSKLKFSGNEVIEVAS